MLLRSVENILYIFWVQIISYIFYNMYTLYFDAYIACDTADGERQKLSVHLSFARVPKNKMGKIWHSVK